MSEPIKHHYFAQFHLKAWAEKDGRIPTYQRISDGTIKFLRFRPENTAFENRLYTLEGAPVEEQHRIEKEFFAEKVDGKAASIYRKLISKDFTGLSDREKDHWIQYLLAQMLRVPNVVRWAADYAKGRLESALAAREEEYQAIKGDLPYETAKDWYDQTRPYRLRNIGMSLILENIQNPIVAQIIREMDWWVHDLSSSYAPLLASDRPIIVTEKINEPNCAILIPLTPSKLFVAGPPALWKHHAEQDPTAVAQRINELELRQADRCVYGNSGRLLVEKFMLRR